VRVKTISLTNGSNGTARLAISPSRSVENEIASRPGRRPPGAEGEVLVAAGQIHKGFDIARLGAVDERF
jgi:hypothetical protein